MAPEAIPLPRLGQGGGGGSQAWGGRAAENSEAFSPTKDVNFLKKFPWWGPFLLASLDALEHLEVDVTEALKHDLSFPY